MELRDYIFILRRRFLWFLSFAFITLLIFYILYLFQHKYYSYEIRLFYQPKITSLPLQVIAKSTIEIQFTKNPEFWTQLMKKEEFLGEIASIYNYLKNKSDFTGFKDMDGKKVSEIVSSAKKLPISQAEKEKVIDMISEFTKVYITTDNKFLIIESISDSPETATLLAKAVALTYFTYGYNEAISGIDELKKYYLENINSLNTERVKLQSLKDGDVSNLKANYEITQTLINDLHSQILKLHTERISYKEKIRVISNYMRDVKIQEEPNEPYKSSRTLQLEKELFDAKVKLSNLKMNVTEDHPEYKKMVNTIQILTDTIIQERKKDLFNYHKNLQSLLKEIEVKIESLTDQKNELEGKLRALKARYEKITEEESKRREVDEQLRLIKTEITRLDAILNQAPNYFSFYMTTAPQLRAGKPISKYLYVWLLFSIVIGIVGAYGRESIDTSLKSEYDIKKYLNLEVLGIIPYVKDIDLLFKKEHTGHRETLDKATIEELFVGIASIIDEKSSKDSKKILTVTSSLKYEGKSVCIFAIANALSRINRKVLLIDGDLRSPSLHKFFELENKEGLFNLHTHNINDIIITINDKIDFLSAGFSDTNPVEYLARGTIKEILWGLKNRYDYILLDSPPLVNVSDSLIYSKMSNGVILIIAAGETNRIIAKWTKHLLEGVNVNIMGVILNKAFTGITGKYYYYKYQSYSQIKTA